MRAMANKSSMNTQQTSKFRLFVAAFFCVVSLIMPHIDVLVEFQVKNGKKNHARLGEDSPYSE